MMGHRVPEAGHVLLGVSLGLACETPSGDRVWGISLLKLRTHRGSPPTWKLLYVATDGELVASQLSGFRFLAPGAHS